MTQAKAQQRVLQTRPPALCKAPGQGQLEQRTHSWKKRSLLGGASWKKKPRSWKKKSHSWKKTCTPLESELEKKIQQLEKKMDLVFQLDRRMEKMIPQLEKR